ncbi:MAG: tRNA (uridine(34)/cytosine(34)/5-carboxymethylaminomethyluridine(34)-2'-O)-methyltransferase TrmL [Gammaproteobacteria bacterium]|nr:tRNA (uridine(34)/cytosine(34)/5-carboxymethylaminomethyluridine(34)-2'-O)-methyltransferase TrmL [Gammaproteobacteria bacterium]
MFNVVLYQPEIPPNTGNVIRLCANTGCALHLIHPLGFAMDDRQLKRAGLDYHEWARVVEHASWDGYLDQADAARIWAFSTRGRRNFSEVAYTPGDSLLFGPETRGLPATLMDGLGEECVLRLPMVPGGRSLNLSNAVAVAVYEAWRQQGFTTAVGQKV